MTLVLDAGALIAVERGDRETALVIEAARRDGQACVVPAGVVAQVWRGDPRQVRLARLVNARDVPIEPLTDALAWAAGVLCGRTGTDDIIGASVVVTARRHGAAVVSSDRADLERLDPSLPVIDC